MDLTFGEQVKIILSRKGMTIKELAETIEERTGKKMSRQNLTQRLGRDNFQEQDMRMIAEILGCSFRLTILGESDNQEAISYYKKEEKKAPVKAEETREEVVEKEEKPAAPERDITIGELVEIHEELDALIADETGELPPLETPVEELLEEVAALEAESRAGKRGQQEGEDTEDRRSHGWMSYLQRRRKKSDMADGKEDMGQADAASHGMREIYAEAEELAAESEYTESMPEEENDFYDDYDSLELSENYEEPEEEIYEEDRVNGDVNPYTGREYVTNSVRMHPNRIGYVQVYDREDHAWTDMTEWAFLGYQERKKALLGKDYEPPIYLD